MPGFQKNPAATTRHRSAVFDIWGMPHVFPFARIMTTMDQA
jgi:hypothetical protein